METAKVYKHHNSAAQSLSERDVCQQLRGRGDRSAVRRRGGKGVEQDQVCDEAGQAGDGAGPVAALLRAGVHAGAQVPLAAAHGQGLQEPGRGRRNFEGLFRM